MQMGSAVQAPEQLGCWLTAVQSPVHFGLLAHSCPEPCAFRAAASQLSRALCIPGCCLTAVQAPVKLGLAPSDLEQSEILLHSFIRAACDRTHRAARSCGPARLGQCVRMLLTTCVCRSSATSTYSDLCSPGLVTRLCSSKKVMPKAQPITGPWRHCHPRFPTSAHHTACCKQEDSERRSDR